MIFRLKVFSSINKWKQYATYPFKARVKTLTKLWQYNFIFWVCTAQGHNSSMKVNVFLQHLERHQMKLQKRFLPHGQQRAICFQCKFYSRLSPKHPRCNIIGAAFHFRFFLNGPRIWYMWTDFPDVLKYYFLDISLNVFPSKANPIQISNRLKWGINEIYLNEMFSFSSYFYLT